MEDNFLEEAIIKNTKNIPQLGEEKLKSKTHCLGKDWLFPYTSFFRFTCNTSRYACILETSTTNSHH